MWALALIVALISGAGLWLNTVDTSLPCPANAHRIIDLDAAILPLDASPLEGVYAPNDLLRRAHRLFDGVLQSSESVAIGPGGNLTMLDKFGYLFEAEPADHVPGAVFPDEWAMDLPAAAYVGPGRPLGFHYDREGRLVIADSLKGLIRLDRTDGRLEVLANRISPDADVDPGSVLNYVNDLDIARDGTIYFSDAQTIPVYPDLETGTFYDTFRSYFLGILAGSLHGRLCKYDPTTRRTEVLLSGLWFANGVALSADESFVTVADTNRLRVHRYWLKGPRAGTSEVLISQLPGFPDGISRASDGNLWLALVAPVTNLPKLLKYKAMRVVLAYLPSWARPRIPKWGAVLKISPEGRPLQLLLDPDGSKIAFVSSVTETIAPPRLYFGNVRENYVSYMEMKDVPPLAEK